MTENALRFGVGDPVAGRRAATWKVWATQNSPDVYLVCRRIGSAFKLSLHETGRWHFAFGSRDLFDEDAVPASRFISVYESPPPLMPGLTLACRIQTPWSAHTVPLVESEEPGTVWIPPAPENQAAEVVIFLYDQAPPPGDWAGRDSMGTRFVGQVPLSNGGAVVAVCSDVALVPIPETRYNETKFFKGRTLDDFRSPDLRMITWGLHTDGSIVLLETRVEVNRSDESAGR
ncbi:hypothetical protein [Variovorax rhizosphaerae]|uniref:Uncharacterized protein n=1 Tax=Variovorax rhizosphaerae TaxID=1836200 RepID=A0ABU8WJH0_9BURK